MNNAIFMRGLGLGLVTAFLLAAPVQAADNSGLGWAKDKAKQSEAEHMREPRAPYDTDTRTMRDSEEYRRTENTGNSFDRDPRNNIDGGAESQNLGNMTNPGTR